MPSRSGRLFALPSASTCPVPGHGFTECQRLPVDRFTVSTANRIQGQEFALSLVWHPLAGGSTAPNSTWTPAACAVAGAGAAIAKAATPGVSNLWHLYNKASTKFMLGAAYYALKGWHWLTSSHHTVHHLNPIPSTSTKNSFKLSIAAVGAAAAAAMSGTAGLGAAPAEEPRPTRRPPAPVAPPERTLISHRKSAAPPVI
ncbi:hypothetical protein GCM10018962_02720 [Dactylosporangium matsuzakiense]|uniref:Fatty acid desaturase n=1 Tax=Dactylosporangium matsuzakiense TaxID=53360 RepID=A0A9W6KGH6_9ACTN|nr:hypothetical protein GCM10017581_020440 [Dactylosporangium matsuzakiense]